MSSIDRVDARSAKTTTSVASARGRGDLAPLLRQGRQQLIERRGEGFERVGLQLLGHRVQVKAGRPFFADVRLHSARQDWRREIGAGGCLGPLRRQAAFTNETAAFRTKRDLSGRHWTLRRRSGPLLALDADSECPDRTTSARATDVRQDKSLAGATAAIALREDGPSRRRRHVRPEEMALFSLAPMMTITDAAATALVDINRFSSV